jgi:metal-sulfur cluster biosynthetic enzyme
MVLRYKILSFFTTKWLRWSLPLPARSFLCGTLERGEELMPVTEDDVLSALKQCYDPEIPVNIVDLGLIYGVRFEPADDQQDVTIDMTLTAQGCPAHVTISDQVKARLEQLPGIRDAKVNVVWSPPWTPERLSPDARKQLGIE